MSRFWHRVLRIPPHIAIFASVRVRIARWYFLILLIALFALGGSFYGMETSLMGDATDAQLEAPLIKAAQNVSATYQVAISAGETLAERPVNLASGQIVLVLDAHGAKLDVRGPLTNDAIQQMSSEVEAHQPFVTRDLLLDPQHPSLQNYRIFITPLFNGDTRVGNLVVGLPRDAHVHLIGLWLGHAIIVLIFSTISGYWLASRSIRPVQRIAELANEITSTDLRRRLNMTRRDEFGALASTFDQMLSRLEAAFKRQTQFTADASHELRTPLTIITLEANRALTQRHTSEEQQRILRHIQDENERMTQIVNSLLLLARSDTGQIILQRESVDLGDVIVESVERLLPLAQQSQIGLSVGVLPEIVITGDLSYLGQMLMNLIENGIKYTRGVGTRVQIELACEGNRWAVMRVLDDGPGIAEEHLPFLFGRFYRVDKARTRQAQADAEDEPGGTGLGLAIVQWIAQAHGGEVEVTSTIGVGSTFAVRLPLSHDPS